MPLNIILFLKYFSFLSFQNFLMGEKLLSAPLSKHHCCHSFISMTKLHQHSFTHNCPCGRELFSFISPGNVSICTRESLKRASDQIIAFWLSFHSLGYCMCESVLRKTFACLYVYWWVCERKTERVCSTVCANELLIFHICPFI